MKCTIRVVAVALIAVLTAGVAFASGAQQRAATTTASRFVDGRYDPPITLTTPMGVHDPENWVEGDSNENNSFTRWIERELGIRFEAKWFFPDHATNATRLSLAMASGDMPDVIYAPDAEIAKLAQGGALMPLRSVIEQNASPLANHIIGLNQDYTGGRMFWPYTFDGDFYGVPHTAEIVWHHNWIRSDIVSDLGKSLPNTIEELEAILAAYRQQHPNGIGFVLHQNLGGMETVMQAFGAFPRAWIEHDDGQLVYGSVQPAVRQGLETLARWYRAGYVDREFVVKDGTKAMVEPVSAGQALALYGPWWHIWFPFPNMWENVPDAEMAAFAPLRQRNGQRQMLIQSPFYGWGTAIRAGYPHPEALVHILNEVVDSRFRNNTEMRDLLRREYGFEFKYPITPVQAPQNPEARDFAQRFNYERPGYGFFNDGASHHNRSFGFYLSNIPDSLFRQDGMFDRIVGAVKTNTVDQLSVSDRREHGNYMQYPNRMRSLTSTTELIQQIRGTDVVIFNAFQGAPTPAMTESKAYLDKLELETFVKIVMGEEPITAFDRFVQEWRSAGGDAITQEVNDWYREVRR